MCTRLSLFQLSHLPETFGLTVLLIALTLLLTPYLAGVDLGVVKMPQMSGAANRVLRWVGPFLMLAAVGAYAPAWPLTCPATCQAVSMDPGNATVLDFHNLRGRPVRVAWFDTDGKESDVAFVLAPSDHYEQSTYAGQAWCVFDFESKAFVAQVVASTEPRQQFDVK
jgi:hypothetical protein